jgi:hypothetical protein
MEHTSFEVREFLLPFWGDKPIRDSAEAVLQEHFARHPLDTQASSGAVAREADLTELLIGPAGQAHLQYVLDRWLQERRRAGPAGGFGVAEGFPWLLVVSVPLSAFLTSFLSEAGKDAYLALKTLLGKLLALFPTKSIHNLELRDPGLGLVIEVHDRLPERAYQELMGMAIPKIPSEYAPDRLPRLRWDAQWVLTIPLRVPESYRRIASQDEPKDIDRVVPHPTVKLAWKAADHRWMLLDRT